MKKPRSNLGFLALALVALGGAAPAPSTDDILATMNKDALAAYSAGRQQFIAKPGPVLIVGADMTFLLNGQEMHANYTPQSYTTLKILSHAYLGTITLLEPFAADPAAHQDLWRPHLEAIRQDVQAILPHLNDLGLDADSIARNRFILEHVAGFIDTTLKSGQFTSAGLTTLGRTLGPLLLADADLAAKAQIDMMNAAVSRWRAQVGPDVWSQVTVVVEGPHQPRKDNLQMAFFRHELGDRAPTHLIYAENVYDQTSVLNLVGTVETDRALAIATFNDPLRMQRDLLGDAAHAYLLQLSGALGKSLP